MQPRYPGQAAATLRARAQNVDPRSQQYQNIRQRLQGIREKRQATPSPAPNVQQDQVAPPPQTPPYQPMPEMQTPPYQAQPWGTPAPMGPPMGGGYTGGYQPPMYNPNANNALYAQAPAAQGQVDLTGFATDLARAGYQPQTQQGGYYNPQQSLPAWYRGGYNGSY